MTQPNDPWAAASATPAAPAPTSPAPTDEASSSGMAAAFGPAMGSAALFAPPAAAPSLFNKTHFLGTERIGIIKKTEDKQDQDFNEKKPKYWSTSKVGGKAITTEPIDAPTGQPNRPVIVTHITLQTDYRMEQAEALAVGRDAAFGQSDGGERVEVINGFDYKPFGEAMGDARGRGIALNSAADLVGKRLTVKRAGQKPNPSGKGNPSWVKTYRIDNA